MVDAPITATVTTAGKTLSPGGKLLETTTKVASTTGKVLNVAAVPLDAYFAIDDGFKAYDASIDPNASRQDVTIHSTRSVLGVTSTAAGITTLATAGAATGTTAATIGTVATGYGLVILPIMILGPYTTASAHYDVNSAFNPSATKSHMVGLASGQMRNELLGSSTKPINWADSNFLIHYDRLLGERVSQLEHDISKNDSSIPDGIRIVYTGGHENVTKQLDRRSELSLARAAHAELKQHMEEISQLKQFDAEVKVAQAKLTGGVLRELNVTDLDRDGDGVLTQKDKEAIRKTAQNDKFSDVLFQILAAKNVTFENQPLQSAAPELPANVAVKPVHPSQGTMQVSLESPKELSLFERIGAGISQFFGMITGALSSLLGMKTTVQNDLSPVSAEIKTNHPRIQGKDPMEDVAPQIVGTSTNNISIKR